MEYIQILSSIGAIHAAMLSVFLFVQRRLSQSNLYLALLLLAIALRAGKSVLHYYTDEPLPPAILYTGLAAFLAIGPALYLYARSLLQPGFSFKSLYLLHFVPALLTLLIGLFAVIEYRQPFSYFFYKGILGHLALYLLYLGYWLRTVVDAGIRTAWLRLILAAVTLLWAVYVIDNLFGYGYLAGAILVTLLVYVSALYGFRFRRALFLEERIDGYARSTLLSKDLQQLRHRLVALFEQQQLHHDTELNSGQLAARLNISTHQLSEFVNVVLGQSVPDLINQYRVASAKDRLLQEPGLKIAAVAFDCGYKSLSTFNAAFKANTGLTPSNYRQSHLAKPEL